MYKQVTIKRRKSATEWESIYPKTTIDQIIDLSTIARNIFDLEEAVSEDSVLKINSNSTVSTIKLTELAAAIGAAEVGHQHRLDQLIDWESTMSNYAKLDGGVVDSSHLPSWVIGGLKLVGTKESSFTLDDAARESLFQMPNSVGTGEELKLYSGSYIIIEPATGQNDVEVTVAGNNKITGEEGSGEITSGGKIKLETGDWLVFREGKKVDSTTTYTFDIINNTYQRATEEFYGTAILSASTTRANLNPNSKKVIDESALRKILKSIHYTDNLSSLSDVEIGDIVFYYGSEG